jgi:general secretion pathway protein G
MPRALLRAPYFIPIPWPRRRQRGLTVIEIAVVLAIVGVLGSIANNTYSAYRERARIAQSISELATMGARLNAMWDDTHSYPATLDEVFPNARDPWGRPYQYLSFEGLKGKGQVRKDHALVPINTRFDLYSLGPDGASQSPLTAKASRDDIIWARDGAFVGRASDF